MQNTFDRIRRGDVSSPAGEHSSPLRPADVNFCIIVGLVAVFCNKPCFFTYSSQLCQMF